MGRKTGAVDLTRGELGTRGSAELRMEEAAAAGRIMGLTARENLGLRDGFFGIDEESRLAVIRAIRKFQPDIVLAHAVTDRHPDHGRGALLVREAAFLSGLQRIPTDIDGETQQAWRPRVVYHYHQYYTNEIHFVVDISAHFEKKMEAVKAYGSQFYDPSSKEPSTLISTPAFLDHIRSRADPVFLEKLFGQEIPEVFDGLITVKKVVRIPGEKAKVAVDSYDDRIDPVGACVGMKGSRIHGIVRELGNENIDVINYTSNLQLYITRALSPARVTSVKLNENTKRAEVLLKPEEVSKAIGRGGHNIRLAGQLTGYEIDVFREGAEEDVELSEFSDEIEDWIILEFSKAGLDTAKSILEQDVQDLVKRTDLEEETILDVIRILKEEFEE
ncbi:MAG: bacillithiol biosynthesis deacetylase BshB1 [Gelidibacter sp.]|nr:bacillithiol biosynthesis deacetylase BshB1 [Gelidibacter sp.]